MEIQNGGSRRWVRESQMAEPVNEGKVADVFGPGMHTDHPNLPVLTYLKTGDKLRVPTKKVMYFSAPASRWIRSGARPSPSPSATRTARCRRRFWQPAWLNQLFHTEIFQARETYTTC
jgi:membrane protease subunit (stomatin/prohibitin family)